MYVYEALCTRLDSNQRLYIKSVRLNLFATSTLVDIVGFEPTSSESKSVILSVEIYIHEQNARFELAP